MHLEEGLQPPGALVVMALHRNGVFRHLTKTECDAPTVIDNDCIDPRTIHKRHQYMCELNDSKTIVRVDGIGGAVKLSPFCPGYIPEYFIGMVDDFKDAAGILNGSVIGLSSHGEECGLCRARGITVAQRIWLSVDARQHLKAALQPVYRNIGIYVTYHRRYVKGDTEYQKTRVVDHSHKIFNNLPIERVMHLSDREMVEMLAPDLLERVAEPC